MRSDHASDKTPRKVAFVLPAYRLGGMEVSMFRIAGYFKQSGWHVTMMATEEPGEWFHRIAELGFQPVELKRFSAWDIVRQVREVGRYLAAERFDLVFTVFDRFSQAALGLVDESAMVVPLLRNDHPDVYEIGLANSRRWNVAVGNSPKICKVAGALQPDKDILLIPNGVTTAPYRNRNWHPGEVRKLLFVGRLVHESKRVLVLPNVMRVARDLGVAVHLQIAGDGPDREALQRRIDDLNLSDCCELLGHVAEPQLQQLYDDAHAIIFLSAYEGFPNVLLEGMSRGCVPIATRLPGITDYLIDHASSGYLVGVEDDVHAIVQALEQLATTEVGAALSKKAWQTVQARFSTEVESASFMQLVSDFDHGRYRLPRPRHGTFHWRLFTGTYAYRKIIKPCLAQGYMAVKRLLRPRNEARSC
jgi:glycosyltransferase involved in cell wall biosynthesis